MSTDPQSAQLAHKVTFLNLWIALAWVLSVSPVDCHGQGTVFFSNSGFPIITNNLQGATGRITAQSYYFGLYLGTSEAAVQNSTTPVLVIMNNSFPGIIGGGSRDLPGFNADTSYYFQVKGWSVAGGSLSYEAALNNDPWEGRSKSSWPLVTVLM